MNHPTRPRVRRGSREDARNGKEENANGRKTKARKERRTETEEEGSRNAAPCERLLTVPCVAFFVFPLSFLIPRLGRVRGTSVSRHPRARSGTGPSIVNCTITSIVVVNGITEGQGTQCKSGTRVRVHATIEPRSMYNAFILVVRYDVI